MENRRSKDDEVPRGMWKAVKTGARKVGMGEAEGRREKGRSWKKEGRKGKEEKIENSRS